MPSCLGNDNDNSYNTKCAIAMAVLGGYANGWAASCGAMIVYHVNRVEAIDSTFLSGIL